MKRCGLPGSVVLSLLAVTYCAAPSAGQGRPRSGASQPARVQGKPRAARPNRVKAAYRPGPFSPSPRDYPGYGNETYVRYPGNWAEVVQRAQRYGAAQRMEDAPTRQARSKFNATVPEIVMEPAVSLADAFERIGRDSGLNVFVNWPGLQQYGVTREQEVSLPRLTNVTWRKVVELLLMQVNAGLGGAAQVDWMLDGGLLTIATRDDMNTYMTTRVYDAGDLLVPPLVVQPNSNLNLPEESKGKVELVRPSYNVQSRIPILYEDLIDPASPWRHHPDKLARCLLDLPLRSRNG